MLNSHVIHEVMNPVPRSVGALQARLQNGVLGMHPAGGQMRWKSEGAKSGLLGETKCKVQTCAGKVMVSVVCDSEGTLLVDITCFYCYTVHAVQSLNYYTNHSAYIQFIKFTH